MYMKVFLLFAGNIRTAVRFSKRQLTSDVECPDGGCNRPWYALPISQISEYQLILGCSGTLLGCKIHYCPLKCHQIFDHSRVRCESLLSTRCTNGHSRKWKCQDGPPVTCQRCERERRAAEQAKAEQARLQEQREAERSRFQQEMAQLDDFIVLSCVFIAHYVCSYISNGCFPDYLLALILIRLV
jgi:hypothetical protein